MASLMDEQLLMTIMTERFIQAPSLGSQASTREPIAEDDEEEEEEEEDVEKEGEKKKKKKRKEDDDERRSIIDHR